MNKKRTKELLEGCMDNLKNLPKNADISCIIIQQQSVGEYDHKIDFHMNDAEVSGDEQ